MSDWYFFEFVLELMIPAILSLAHDIPESWILSLGFLAAISRATPKFIEARSTEKLTFGHIVVILKRIMNSVGEVHSNFGNDIDGVHPQHRGFIAIVCQFFRSLMPAIRNYLSRHLEEDTTEVLKAFDHFMEQTAAYFRDGTPIGFARFTIHEGRFESVSSISEEISRDIVDNWVIDRAQGQLAVRLSGARGGNDYSLVDLDRSAQGIFALREVVEEPAPCRLFRQVV